MVRQWAAIYRPTQIEMTDNQYSWYAHLCGKNSRDFDGIPIIFMEGPRAIL